MRVSLTLAGAIDVTHILLGAFPDDGEPREPLPMDATGAGSA